MVKQSLIWTLSFIIGFSSISYSQVTDTSKVVVDSLKSTVRATTDTIPGDTIFTPIEQPDEALRIRNLNPYISLHVDSTWQYELEINKDQSKYYWYLMNAPVGLRVDRNTGLLQFKADKRLFLSGRLKYDTPYTVNLGVQNLDSPVDKIDTSFTLMFYNTETIPSKVKPAVNNILYLDEGDTVAFRIQCEDGSFPIEKITMTSNYPLNTFGPVAQCGDEFKWSPPFGFTRDVGKEKKVIINFIGTNRFNTRDTSVINIIVKENINYPQKALEHKDVVKSINTYSTRLKATFMTLDKQVKRTKGTRTSFDLSSAATALGGTVFSSLPTDGQKTAGKILPSAGVAMVPVKESVAPSKTAEQKQNSASLLRNNIKRLEYSVQNNSLVGDRDPDILAKTQRMRDVLKEIQTQLIEVPIVDFDETPEELDKYFNSNKVNKKYRMKK